MWPLAPSPLPVEEGAMNNHGSALSRVQQQRGSHLSHTDTNEFWVPGLVGKKSKVPPVSSSVRVLDWRGKAESLPFHLVGERLPTPSTLPGYQLKPQRKGGGDEKTPLKQKCWGVSPPCSCRETIPMLHNKKSFKYIHQNSFLLKSLHC